MKVAVKLRKPDYIWDIYIKKLEKVADTVLLYDNQLSGKYDNIEVLITTHVSKDELSSFSSLKKIFLFKTGTDGLPISELKERNISISCSHANAEIIAEHAIALSLALLHRIPEFHNDMHNGIWYSNGSNYYWESIRNQRIGILGYGHIGSCIHQKLSIFTNNIIVFRKSAVYPKGVKYASTADDLIKQSDMIFLCLPKTKDTIGLINHKRLQNMKGKRIVNVGRAEICDEKALFEALKSETLAGFASDVWYREPDKTGKINNITPSAYPFEQLKNVIMSPHCATHEVGAHERYIRDAVTSCINYILKESL